MTGARRARRWALIASPFLLLALGFAALVYSPWPAIWGLMQRGQHVYVAYTASTVGKLALAVACFAGALAISFNIRPKR